ncbi:MAG TPA: ATP-binding cassette domain-containing protein [Solirubrobacteraceae bacterium]|jgi:lipoprotein-releasing system ATP-binding protein|nr:ATP-binding cassette domain-containing protein [Solirubrobacteraceae bacterium]
MLCRRVAVMGELLSLEGVCKGFRRGGRRVSVLTDVTLAIGSGEIVAVVGPRHAGKTTLLKLAGGLEESDAGIVRFADLDLAGCSDEERSRLLGHEIAWVHCESTRVKFQVLDDLALPLVMGRGHGRREAEDLAMEALERVGMAECARRRWEELSNWERVLVGLARGFACRPRLMLVDNVIDGFGMMKTKEAGDLLLSFVADTGCGVLMSASDIEPAIVADRVWGFEGQRLKLLSDLAQRGAKVIALHDDSRRRHGSSGAG